MLLALVFLSRSAWGYEVPRRLDDVLREWDAGASSPSAALLIPEMAGLWDDEDPQQVLAAVERVAADRRTPSWVAGYARWVQAMALLRLGRVEDASRIVQSLGFVQEWMVVGPFDNDNEAGFEEAYPPEERLGQALDVSATYTGRLRPVTWRQLSRDLAQPDGSVELGEVLDPHESSCAYLATALVARGPARAAIRLGSDGAVRVWLNGVSVYSDDGDRAATPDRAAAGVMLQRGRNQLVVKSCNVTGPWSLYLRLTQPDGRPLAGWSVDPTVLGTAPPRGRDGFEVPSFWSYFFDQVGGAEPDTGGEGEAAPAVAPADVPARAHAELARFLARFGGDDPSEHRARDEARAAVDAEPSAHNLKLLAELHSDRNERLRSLRRALEVEPDDVETLMALAGELANGPHPEDALEPIARVERIDPGNVHAALARLDVLESFGLHQTALSMARELAARNPTSRVLAVLRGLANRAGNVEVEEGAVRQVFESNRASIALREELAQRHAERRENDQAIELLRGGLAFSPASTSLRGELSTVLEAAGQIDAALELRRDAIEIRPDDGELHEALAHLLDRMGRSDEAVTEARRSLELRPENPWLRQWLSVVSREDRFEVPYIEEPDAFLARRGQGSGYDVRTLLDLQVRKVHPSGQSDQFRQLVFEAVTIQGAHDLATYSVAFTPHRQRLTIERARIHLPDGTTREATQRSTRDVYDASIRMYYDLRVTTVSFGDIQPGDVVEIRYRISDVGRSNELGSYFGELSLLQEMRPCAREAYVLLVPPDRDVHFNEPALASLQHRTRALDGEVEHVWEATDVPAISAENDMPPLAESAPVLLVSTYDSWEELGRWYWTLVRDQLELDSGQRARAEELVRGATTDLERVRAIHRHVVQSVRYVALEFGVHRFKPYRVADIERRGFGDCKDQASLMIALLEHVGVEAEIVLLRTRNLGNIVASPPSLEVFNHAIVYVPSLGLYIDPTAERVAVGDLPSGDQGVMTLRVGESSVTFGTTPMARPQDQMRRVRLSLELDRDGNARGALEMQTTGWLAGASRAQLDDPANRVNHLEQLLSRYLRGVRVSDVETSDVAELDTDNDVTASVEVPSYARQDGADLSFAASIAPPLTSLVNLPERQHDLVLGPPLGWTEEVVLRLPPGFTPTSLPEPVTIESPIATFDISVTAAPARTVMIRSSIMWLAERVTPEQYPELRRFVEGVTQARTTRIRLAAQGEVQ
jgi:tetratricopeptide (TPR) repeat protein